jgi:hypothetical protein
METAASGAEIPQIHQGMELACALLTRRERRATAPSERLSITYTSILHEGAVHAG